MKVKDNFYKELGIQEFRETATFERVVDVKYICRNCGYTYRSKPIIQCVGCGRLVPRGDEDESKT